MYKNKKILAIIPARGGSKGIPRKNIKDFDGRPLMYWTLDEVQKSRYIDACAVSTEDAEIMEYVQKYSGVGLSQTNWLQVVKRPVELAADDTPSIAPVLHVVDNLPGYDYVVLLQVTSPMRTVTDIDGCIERCLDKQAESCVSVCEAESSPYWMYSFSENGTLQRLLPTPIDAYQRQKLPPVYQLNGAVYVSSVDFLRRERGFIGKNTLGYVMSSTHSGDIDTPQDFEILAYLHSRR